MVGVAAMVDSPTIQPLQSKFHRPHHAYTAPRSYLKMGKNDKKPAEKKDGGKSAGGKKGAKGESDDKGGKAAKGAQSINVRHILVSIVFSGCGIFLGTLVADSKNQCEKHAKKEEALAKLRDGTKFDEVAREFSEDKARQGE